jgi:hypothetical protein
MSLRRAAPPQGPGAIAGWALTGLALLLAACAATPTVWRPFLQQGSTQYSFSAENISRRPDGRVRVAMLVDQAKPMPGVTGQAFRSAIDYLEFNCFQDRYKRYRHTEFDGPGGQGIQITSDDDSAFSLSINDLEWSSGNRPPPELIRLQTGTPEQALFRIVCRSQ